ncbi:MAG TPA: magnesium transporter CorA family protein, partial [Polyangiaceae bacterium]
ASRDASTEDVLRPPTDGQCRFIDCIRPSAADLSILQKHFELHPVAIEDCAQFDPRPKFEVYDDHLFIVIHAVRPATDEKDRLDSRELHAFLMSNCLIAVHDEPIDGIEVVCRRIHAEPALAKRGSAYLYYLIADTITAAVFPWIEEIIERIELAEDGLSEAPSSAALTEAFAMRRLLASIRRVLAPQREVFAALIKFESPIFSKKVGPFFRSLHGDVMRLTELVETAREHVSNLREAYSTAMSQRTNVVVHRLTMLNAVFLPLTFLTGFFGQNFEALPFHSHALFYVELAITLLIPLVMFVWFRRRGWW